MQESNTLPEEKMANGKMPPEKQTAKKKSMPAVKAHWRARITRSRSKPYLGKILTVSPASLLLENDFNLRIGEKIKVEVAATFKGRKKILTALGVVRSSVLRSCGQSYGLKVAVERMKKDDQAFIQDYMSHTQSLGMHR